MNKSVIAPPRGNPLLVSVNGDLLPRRLLGLLNSIITHSVVVLHSPVGYERALLLDAWLSLHPSYALHVLTDGEPDEEALHTIRGSAEVLVLRLSDDYLAKPRRAARLIQLVEEDDRLRIVSLSRAYLTSLFGRLAARKRLFSISFSDLSWTDAETDEYLADLLPDSEELTAIRRSWCGWPVAQRLLQQHLAGRHYPVTDTHLLDSYIDTEIIAPLSAQDRHALIQLSTLTSHTKASAQAVTGDNHAMHLLGRLPAVGIPVNTHTAANATGILEPVRRRLFAELLRDTELAETVIHRSVTRLVEEGRDIDAIELASTVDDYTALVLTADFLMRHIKDEDFNDQISRLREILPSASWITELFGLFASPEPMPRYFPKSFLEKVSLPLLDFGEHGRLAWGLLHLMLARDACYQVDNIDEILAVVQEANTLDSDPLMSMRAGLLIEHGLFLVHHGQLAEAIPLLLEGAEAARAANQTHYRCLGLGVAAFAQAMRGYNDQASKIANICFAIERTSKLAAASGVAYAHLGMVEANCEAGNLDGALKHLDAYRSMPNLSNETYPLYVTVRGTADLLRGHAREVLDGVAALSASSTKMTVYHQALAYMLRIYALLLSGDVAGARSVVNAIPDLGPSTEAHAAKTLLEAQVLLQEGNYQESIDLLSSLANCADDVEPTKATLYATLFYLEACQMMGRTDEVERLKQRAKTLAELMGVDYADARHKNLYAIKTLTEPLTETEMKVLYAINSDDALGTIAAKLFISINTLKTHLRRLYRKLDVTSRQEAIERALARNLIAPDSEGTPLAD